MNLSRDSATPGLVVCDEKDSVRALPGTSHESFIHSRKTIPRLNLVASHAIIIAVLSLELLGERSRWCKGVASLRQVW